jgi:thiol oxidase
MVDMKTSLGYLPNDYKQYQHCAGSEPKYRGYPCALWLLFHTLTISQYHQGIESQQIDAMEIPLAIKNYVKYFFTCRQCSDNFMNETSNIDQLKSKNKHEAIIYLWKSKNHFP